MQADYSMVMPFIVKALLDNRARYARWAEKMGEEALFAKHPKARGYLRSRDGYRLYDKRAQASEQLLAAVRNNAEWLAATLQYPLGAK
jgi:deoxyhypusine synthase